MNRTVFSSIVIVICLVLSGCATGSAQEALSSSKSQVDLRQIQTRAFDTTNKTKMLKTIIATLQDLGFIIDKASDDLGTVSATKLDGYQLKMTVSVRPRGQKQLLVRANAQYQVTTVEDPLPYQQFFTALEKGIFLSAHQVD